MHIALSEEDARTIEESVSHARSSIAKHALASASGSLGKLTYAIGRLSTSEAGPDALAEPIAQALVALAMLEKKYDLHRLVQKETNLAMSSLEARVSLPQFTGDADA